MDRKKFETSLGDELQSAWEKALMQYYFFYPNLFKHIRNSPLRVVPYTDESSLLGNAE